MILYKLWDPIRLIGKFNKNIKAGWINIYNIEIYKVTNQYLEYLNTRKVMDLEITSEFIVVAATLIEIKSKNLLPKVKVDEEEESEEDIEKRLMERLIEYKKIKNVSEFFKNKYINAGEVFSKKPEIIEEIKPEKIDNDDIFKNLTLLDLYNIYNKILETYREKQNKVNVVQKKIYVDKYKVEDKMEELLERFNSSEVIEFNNLMKESTCKLETVVTFLALLELIKIRTIQVFQDESFSNILIKRRRDIE